MAKPTKSQDPIQELQIRQAIGQALDLHKAGKLGEAAAMCQRILKLDPRQAGALHLMGHIALQTGAPEIAVGSLNRALVLAPNAPGILADLGRALSDLGKHAEAVSAFRKALLKAPNDAKAHIGLAEAQLNLDKPAEALAHYRKALELSPGNKLAQHMISALTGERRADGMADYVPLLFDGYADKFDKHLGSLQYHVPEKLREALEPFRPANGFAAALDLGCGTGLVGLAIRDIAPTIDGIDIAPKMIEQAKARNLYRHLRAGDTVEVLGADPDFAGPYDLVTSADVFIYVGPLEATFATLRARMAPGAIFAFSVEQAPNGAGSLIRSSGRFAHSPDYIDALAAEHGFTQRARHDLPIRTELKQPIPGQIYILQRD